MSEAFSRTKKMAEGLAPNRFERIQSRALAGWGENAQPPRFQGYLGNKGPLNRCTMAGGTKSKPIVNITGTVTPARGATRQV